MYVYDRANALAQDIKESSEFKEYKALKDEVMADATNKDLIRQYKTLQFEAPGRAYDRRETFGRHDGQAEKAG